MDNLDGKTINIERREIPEILYIGTQTSGIKEFTPREGNYRDKNEGAVIFSTPDKALASVFMIDGHNDSWTKIGYYGDILVVVICMDKELFIKKDKGGLLYEVPSDTFDYNDNLGMGDKEWTSREPVKTLKETNYTSVLDTMINNGVRVYFVSDGMFKDINMADDHGQKILSELISENDLRNKEVKKL